MKILKSTKIKIFLTVLIVYLFYIAPYDISASPVRYTALARSIVDNKSFAITDHFQYVIDRSFYKGEYYIGAAPGMSFMAAPIYAVLKLLFKNIPENIYVNSEFFYTLNFFFILLLSVLPGALIAVLLYDMLGKFDLKESEKILITFISSFGTLLFYYSTRFTAHAMGAFMLFSAFYILFKFKNELNKKFLYFLSGTCLGAAVLVDYYLIVGSIIIFAYAISNFQKNKIINFSLLTLGCLLMAFIHMYYHYKCFDSPFALAADYGFKCRSGSILWPKPMAIYELSFGFFRGIFIYMPILLVSAYGIYCFLKQAEKKFAKEIFTVFLFSLSIFMLIAGYLAWDAGGAFGQRYFVCFIPFLMIPMAFALKRMNYKLILWLAAVSIFINWCGVQYGDADSAFVNIGLFIFRGLNSNMSEWLYRLVNTYIRQFNVITHFSPLIPFLILLSIIYAVWKPELKKARG